MELEISGSVLNEIPPANSADEQDLLPEYCHYRDEGCELAASCLECPFPQCVHEEGGKQRWKKEARDREIMRLFREGKNTRDLAHIFGVDQRTIQRALKRANE